MAAELELIQEAIGSFAARILALPPRPLRASVCRNLSAEVTDLSIALDNVHGLSQAERERRRAALRRLQQLDELIWAHHFVPGAGS